MDCDELLDWHDEQYSLGEDVQNELSSCLWEDDSLLYMLDEQTPAKQCLDFGGSDCSHGDNVVKSVEVYRESSLTKRRRMLQFDSDGNDLPCFSEQFSSVIINSKAREESHPSHELQSVSCWNQADNSGDSAFDSQLLDQSSADWFSNCLDDNNMLCDEIFTCGIPHNDIDISEYCNIQPEEETIKVSTPQMTTPSRIKIKSRKSSIKLPTTPTSVAYPFTLVKPCGGQGDVTLSDINHRIHTPSPKKLQLAKDAKEPIQYPTSALTGKPVVAQTKIRTQGGKGSITITRTKG